MRGSLLIFLLCACTRPNPDNHILPGETCSSAQVCARGSYQLCELNGACRYLGSDGTSFSCGSCNSCSLAQLSIASWCVSGGTTGVTNGGTTNGGTTNGGTIGGTTNGGTIGGTTNGGTNGGNGSTTGSTTGSTGSTTGTQTCEDCLNNAELGVCAAPVNTCFNDPACSDLATCYSNCSSQTCQMTCFDNAPPSAQNELNAAGDCNCAQCATPCAGSCTGRVRGGSSGGTTSGGTTSGGTTSGGTTSTTGSTTSGDACDSCAISSEGASGACSSQYNACVSDSKCSALITCFANCGSDTTCRMQCYTTAGTGASNKFNAVAICVCQNCSACASRCSGM